MIVKMEQNLAKLTNLSLHEEGKTVSQSSKEKTTSEEKSQEFSQTDLLFSCRTVSDITNKFQEFTCDAENGLVICVLCHSKDSVKANYNSKSPGVFQWNEDVDSRDRKKFNHLKANIKDHLS